MTNRSNIIDNFNWIKETTEAEYLGLLATNHLPLTDVGSAPVMDFGLFSCEAASGMAKSPYDLYSFGVIKILQKQTKSSLSHFYHNCKMN